MTGDASEPLALTPEQHQRLGQVYRIILNWRRREPLEAEQAEPEPQSPGQAGEAALQEDTSHV